MIRTSPNFPGGIVWLASYPKSGNTWLRIFLYHITRMMVGVPLEGNDLHQLDRSSVYEARLFTLFEQILGKPVAMSDWREIVPIRPQVHAEIVKRARRMIFVKTHMGLTRIMNAPTINLGVTLGAIYVVRNPLDVVLSISNHLGMTLDDAITVMCLPGYYAPSGSEEVYEPWASWSENVESWTGKRSEIIHIIRYEDMLTNPIKVFRSVTNHLKQNPTPEQVAEAVELSSFSRLSSIEKEADFRERSAFAERFFRVGRAGQWKDKLSEDQIRRLVDANYRQMSRFGYLTEELHQYLPEGVSTADLGQLARTA
jgi:hypothetical protein